MTLSTDTQQLRLVLTSWSSSLSIDDLSGESIVTEADLDRLVEILNIIINSDSEHLPGKSLSTTIPDR